MGTRNKGEELGVAWVDCNVLFLSMGCCCQTEVGYVERIFPDLIVGKFGIYSLPKFTRYR